MSSLKKRSESAVAPLTKREIHRIFYGLMLGGFLSAVNQTIVASALPTIGRELGDFHNLSWVIISYLLSSTVVSPLYGKLSDIHGRRTMMLVGIALFVAGSALSAVAPNMAWLIVGRTLQGVGGGGIVPMVQVTVADMVTPRERGHYQAYMGSAWIVAGVVGPALGGVIAERWHWSAIFWLNVPLGVLTAMLVWNSMKRLPRHQRPHQLDLIGAALMIAASVALLMALTSGGTRVPWLSPTIFALIAASIALTIVFVWWLKRAPEPFLPLNVMAHPIMQVGTTATACALAVMTGFMIYMPLYYQTVHGLSPTAAGAALIPIIVLTTPGSMMSGRAMMHLSHYKITAYVGMTLATLAVAALVVWPAMSLAWSIVATGLIGFGVGTVFPVATVSIQNAVARHDVGAATGAMNFFRALGGALIVAIMGAILLAGLGVTPERGGAGFDLTPMHELAVAEVYRYVFASALVFAVIALVAVVLLEERPLEGPAMPVPVAVPPPAPAE
jgi:EmrB/QacA subfamily drug resistance transporter